MRQPRSSGITPCITGLNLFHAQHNTRLPITGNPHNEPSYHTLHNGRGHATRPAWRAFHTRDSLHPQQKGVAITLSREPNGLRFNRAAPIDREGHRFLFTFKIAMILRPQSGVGCKRLLDGAF
jgi:hypothetical protein